MAMYPSLSRARFMPGRCGMRLDAPLVTFGSNGCLGVDINAWGVALAWCNPEGKKPAKGMDWRSNILMDWTGSSEHALSEIRVRRRSKANPRSMLTGKPSAKRRLALTLGASPPKCRKTARADFRQIKRTACDGAALLSLADSISSF